MELLQYLVERNPLWVVVSFVVAIALVWVGFQWALYRIRSKERKEKLEIEKLTIEMDTTATFERGEEISKAQRIALLEQEIVELRLSKVTKNDYNDLAVKLQDVNKTFVERATFERLQADYEKLQQTALKNQPDIIKELGIEIAYLTPLAERATRAEQAYDLLKESLADEATLQRKIVTLTLIIEALRLKLRDNQIPDDVVIDNEAGH